MTRSGSMRVLLSAAVIATGVVLTGGSGVAQTPPATPGPCTLLTPKVIQKQIHESVQPGAPNQYAPEFCDYPLQPAKDLKRSFAVYVDTAAQCPTKLFKGRTIVKVGRRRGVYDVSSRQSTPKTEIHSPALDVKVGQSCVGVHWDLPSGPQPSGSRAKAIQQQLLHLEQQALKSFTG